MGKQKNPKSDGSSEQYIIVSNRPFHQFLVETPEWIKAKEAEASGEIRELVPNKQFPNAGHLMDAKMLNSMTQRFDGYGEYRTKNAKWARIALDGVRQIDPKARLHSTSLALPELTEDEKEEALKVDENRLRPATAG